MLLAGAADAWIIAADLRAVADLREDRCEVVAVVAVRAVDMTVMAVIVPMIMSVVAIWTMHVPRRGGGRGGLVGRRAVGHASIPVRASVFRGIAELSAVPKGVKWPRSGGQSR